MKNKICRNGITVSVQNWAPWRKLPVLAVSFEGENKAYKVASFNSGETAAWFCEIMAEFFIEPAVDGPCAHDSAEEILNDFVEILREDAITDDDRAFTAKVEFAAKQFLRYKTGKRKEVADETHRGN